MSLVLKFKRKDKLRVVIGDSISVVTVSHIGENVVHLHFDDVAGPEVQFSRQPADAQAVVRPVTEPVQPQTPVRPWEK